MLRAPSSPDLNWRRLIVSLFIVCTLDFSHYLIGPFLCSAGQSRISACDLETTLFVKLRTTGETGTEVHCKRN